LDEIGLVVYEEMSFKVKGYGRTTPDKKRSQKFTLGELKKLQKVTKGKLVHCRRNQCFNLVQTSTDIEEIPV
jgi:hypothetical protein